MPAFLAQWRRLDGCRGGRAALRPRRNVVELRWSHCRNGSAVEHDRITDADHGWPGEDDVDGLDGFAEHSPNLVIPRALPQRLSV